MFFVFDFMFLLIENEIFFFKCQNYKGKSINIVILVNGAQGQVNVGFGSLFLKGFFYVEISTFIK